MVELKDIQLSLTNEAAMEKNIIDLLRKHGVAVIPGFYKGDQLRNLNSEFEELLQMKDAFVKKTEYSEGRAVNVRKKDLFGSRYQETFKLFDENWMASITEQYMGPGLDTNVIIYVVNDVVGSKHHANDLHFDVQRSLKFFIYLTDTSKDNGAFFCVPGSNINTAAIRSKYGTKISYENRHLSRLSEEEERSAIPIEGAAGTLIIFDTDVFHRAGFVSKGERRVLRGQSEFRTKVRPSGKSGIFKKLFGK